MNTGSPSTSSAMPEPLAAMKASSFLRSSDETQRASWNSETSNSTGSEYSASRRAFSTSSCNGPTTPTSAVAPPEHLHDALFRHLLQRLFQLLRLHRVRQAHAADDFRRETGHADGGEVLALGQRVADPKRAVVGNADDVAGKRFIGHRAVLGEEELRRRQRHVLAGAYQLGFHAAGEFAG